MSRTPTIIIITTADLQRSLNQRPQHVAVGLASTYDVRLLMHRVRALQGTGPHARFDQLTRPDELFETQVEGINTFVVQQRAGPLSRLTALADSLTIRGMVRAAASQGPWDVAVAESPWAGVAAARLKEVGLVRRLVYDDLDLFGDFADGRPAERWIIGRLERRAIRAADSIVAVSQTLARRTAKLGVRAPIRFIPNGVHWSMFTVGSETRPDNSSVYVGALESWSGVHLAIEAIAGLRDAGLPATLKIFGAGPPTYQRELRDLVKKLALGPRVTLCGRIPYYEIPAALRGARVGLVPFAPRPLAGHAFPLKIPEYWAAGLSVVGTNIGEIGNLLRRGPSSYAVDYDPDSFASAIRRASANWTPTSAHEVHRYAQRYDWSRLMSDFQSVVSDVVSEMA